MRERVVELAEGAATLLKGYAGKLGRADADRKSGAHRDLVSEADVSAEAYLLAHIPEEDDVLAEEGSNRDRGSRRRWILDPLDGTVNFLHGLPCWCVSVGLCEDGELIAAAVTAPALGETFSAARGEGCFANETRVMVSQTKDLSESILATGFAYRRNELEDHNFDNFETLGMAAAGIRRMGSAALDLALLAAGRLDGFWELHLNPWDVAAGTLLVREAGGKVSDFDGDESLAAVLHHRHIVASNTHLHLPLRTTLHPRRKLP